MCVTLYLRYLNNEAIQFNLAAYTTRINIHSLKCQMLYLLWCHC